MGVKALAYFEIASTIAMLFGFIAIQISGAGTGIRLNRSTAGETIEVARHTISDTISNIFPENIAKAVAEGQILQVVVFSILFGLALAMVPEERRRPLLNLAESLSQTMFKFTNLVMFFAPLGAFGAMAYTVAKMGLGVLLPLLKLVCTMYVALVAFIFLVLFPIGLLIGVPIQRFVRAVAEPVILAFATASSEAALPRAIEQMEFMGVSREVVAFVLPTGYSFNLDGSSLYQSIALVFVAQAAGIKLSLSQEVAMMLTLLVSSKGMAGVARASLTVVFAVASSFHLPAEPLFLLFGVDQLMDMGRTAVNVLGNCLATMVIARWEGETVPFLR